MLSGETNIYWREEANTRWRGAGYQKVSNLQQAKKAKLRSDWTPFCWHTWHTAGLLLREIIIIFLLDDYLKFLLESESWESCIPRWTQELRLPPAGFVSVAQTSGTESALIRSSILQFPSWTMILKEFPFPFLCEKKESPIRTCLLRWWRAATSSCAKRLECHSAKPWPWCWAYGDLRYAWTLEHVRLRRFQLALQTQKAEKLVKPKGLVHLTVRLGAPGVWDMVAPSRARRENLRLAEFASLLIPTPAIGIRHH